MNKLPLSLLCLLFVLFSCKTEKKPVYDLSKSIIVDKAAVVSAHPMATNVGLEILKKGGNAVDAAIAVQFALGVCYPVAGNIGGGGFMVYRGKDGDIATLDFREKAPGLAFPDMYLDSEGNAISEKSRAGHLAVGVPGSVDGMVKAFEKYSKLKDWKALVQPSVDMSRNGFKITERQARLFNKYMNDFVKYNTSQNAFTKKKIWMTGDLLKQEDLAKTFEAIRDKGESGFYEGKVAEYMVAEMKAGGGIISLEDMKNYEAVWREPIVANFKGKKVISMPPPSSGGVILMQLLKMMEHQNLAQHEFQSKEATHLMVEAERRAYADRSVHLGDSDFYPVPLQEMMDSLYLIERMSDFSYNDIGISAEVAAGNFDESEETTHFSIVDAEGNAVSITTTINTAYGSKVVVTGAGFFLNNEMDDFSAKPGVPNYFGLIGAEANKVEPGKRMLSSMTPTIIEENGKLKLVVGTPGGSTIITSVFQTIVNIFEFNMSATDAVHSPRFHHQWKPNVIFVEDDAISSTTRTELETMGHKIEERGKIGKVEAILVLENGKLEAVADIRADDHAAGY